MESLTSSPVVLISGGTGLVGKHLTHLLQKNGYSLSYLSRQKQNKNISVPCYYWNPDKGELDEKAIRKADYVVNLAGANVGEKRWTESRKQEILESRTLAVELLADALESVPHQVKAFVSASAIGIYGDTQDKLVDETSAYGNDFLANVCKEWEKQVSLITEAGVRSVILRIGVVLAREAGALPKMAMPVRLGLGAPIAPGSQWISWIHVYDVCRMIRFALEHSHLQGVYNAVTHYITNREFIIKIAKQLHRPLWLPTIPQSILQLFLGEMHQLVTGSCKVSNEKIRKEGFTFEFDTIEKALEHLLLDCKTLNFSS